MPENQDVLALFPLPGVVMFPGMDLPLHIFEERYKEMISTCLEGDKRLGIVYAKGNMCAEVGTVAEIMDVEKLEEGKMNILTHGKKRFKIVSFLKEEPYYEASVQSYEDKEIEITDSLKKSLSEVRSLSTKALSIFDVVSNQELSKNIVLPEDPSELLFLVAANLTCSFEVKQTILETQSMKVRTKKVLSLLKEEVERLQVMLENKKTKDFVVKNGKLKI